MESTTEPAVAARALQPPHWVVWTCVLAGVTAVVCAFGLAGASSDLVRPALQASLLTAVTVPYLVAGLVAWTRRPASRLGPLMVVAGFTLALSALQWSEQAWVFSVGHVLDMLPAAVLLHVFLSYPDGRLSRRPEQVLVSACYVTVVVPQVLKILLGVNPDNVFTLARTNVADDLERLQLSIVAALLVGGTCVLAARRRYEYRVLRRPVSLLVAAFGLSMAMLALLYVAGMAAWSTFELIRNATFAALAVAPVAFLVGLLDVRLARGDVADVLVRLRADPSADLENLLRPVLHDPSFSVAFWLAQPGRWVDGEGLEVTLPDVDSRQATEVVHAHGEPVAALSFDAALRQEPELVDAVTAAAGIALENGRLVAELKARSLELEHSRNRVLEAGQQERRRLERNLHDGAQQRLVALSLELGLLRDTLGSDAEARKRLELAREEVFASLEELREVARGMYPAVLTDHGLAVALESLTARSSVPVRLHIELPHRLAEPVEVAAYYVVSESVANAGKYAHATGVDVQVAEAGGVLHVEVADDGVGGADLDGGTGLVNLVDRIEALGGTLSVDSAVAAGTRVRADIPCR